MRYCNFKAVLTLIALFFLFTVSIYGQIGNSTYQIKHLHIKMQFNRDMSVEVEETIDVIFQSDIAVLVRTIPSKLNSYVKIISAQGGNTSISYDTIKRSVTVTFYADKLVPGDKGRFVLRYLLVGSIGYIPQDDNGKWQVNWPILLGEEWEAPILSSSYELIFPEGTDVKKFDTKFDVIIDDDKDFRLNKKDVIIRKEKMEWKLEKTIADKGQMAITISNIPGDTFNPSQLPFEQLTRSFIVDKYDLKVKVYSNSVIEVIKNYTLSFPDANIDFIEELPLSHSQEFEDVLAGFEETRNKLWFEYIMLNLGKRNLFLEKTVNATNAVINEADGLISIRPLNSRLPVNLTIGYQVIGLISQVELLTNGEKVSAMRLGMDFEISPPAPVKNFSFEFDLPDNISFDMSDFLLTLLHYHIPGFNKTEFYQLEDGNKIIGKIPYGLMPFGRLKWEAYFPLGYFSGKLSSDLRFLFLLINNTWVWWGSAGFISVLILVIVIIVRKLQIRFNAFLPPPGLTTAEAGLLFLTNPIPRNLISLLFYWASQGKMEIIYSKDEDSYRKLQDLPAAARDFEKEIFYSLFPAGKNICNRREIIQVLKRIYSPAITLLTQGLRMHIRTFGLYFQRICLGVGMLAILYSILTAPLILAGYHSIQLILFFSGLIFIIISKLLPKTNAYKYRNYRHTKYFYDFIRSSSTAQLKKITLFHPHYFDITLPYAIGFDLSVKWATKFEQIVNGFPRWVRLENDNDSYISPLELTSRIEKSIKIIEDELIQGNTNTEE